LFFPVFGPEILTAILLLGLLLKIMGFIIRDELFLRVLVASGLACDVAFYGLRAEPILASVAANTLLVSINIVLIVLILFERTTWGMKAEDRALFAHFPTLSPGQFRRLRRRMRIEQAPPGTRLVAEGGAVADLALVFADRIDIAKTGARFPIAGPAFVGEIAFLTGERSSADVTLPEGGRVVRLDIAGLKAAMARSAALKNAMIALFGRELARKVAYSVPMPRAAMPPGAEAEVQAARPAGAEIAAPAAPDRSA
jgi:hypothetical protein